MNHNGHAESVYSTPPALSLYDSAAVKVYVQGAIQLHLLTAECLDCTEDLCRAS